MTSGDVVIFGTGFVIGAWAMAIVYSRARRTIASFWKKAYDDELKKHAETKEHHDATMRNIAAELAKNGLKFLINGKTIESSEDAEWPTLICEKSDQ